MVIVCRRNVSVEYSEYIMIDKHGHIILCHVRSSTRFTHLCFQTFIRFVPHFCLINAIRSWLARHIDRIFVPHLLQSVGFFRCSQQHYCILSSIVCMGTLKYFEDIIAGSNDKYRNDSVVFASPIVLAYRSVCTRCD